MEAHYTKYHKGQNATDAKTKVQFTNDRPYQLKSKAGKKLRTLGEIDREVIVSQWNQMRILYERFKKAEEKFTKTLENQGLDIKVKEEYKFRDKFRAGMPKM